MVATKLTYGEVVSGVVDVYRRVFWQIILLGIGVFFAEGLIAGIILFSAVMSLFTGGLLFLPLLLAAPIALLAPLIWYQGMVVAAVDQAHRGSGRVDFGSVITRVSERWLDLLIAAVIAGIGVMFGLSMLVVPGLYLLTIWALIAPAIVIEGYGPSKAFGRSAQLVSGNGWTVFAVMLTFGIALVALMWVLATFIGSAFAGDFIAWWAGTVLLFPLNALAVAVMYFRLKEIKEGHRIATGPGGRQAA